MNLRPALVLPALLILAACQRPEPGTVSVTTEGKITRQPDQLEWVVEIRAIDPAAQSKAVAAASEAIRQVRQVLDERAAEIREISNSGLQTQMFFDHQGSLRGYSAGDTWRFFSRVESYPALTAALANRPHVFIRSIEPGLQNPQQARAEARDLALELAKEQAAAMARTLGRPLGRPLRVEDATRWTTEKEIALMSAAARMEDAAPALPPLQARPIEVTAQVSAVFELK